MNVKEFSILFFKFFYQFSDSQKCVNLMLTKKMKLKFFARILCDVLLRFKIRELSAQEFFKVF